MLFIFILFFVLFNQAPHPERSPMWVRSHDPEIKTCAEITGQTPNPLSHPGAPWLNFLKSCADAAWIVGLGWRQEWTQGSHHWLE